MFRALAYVLVATVAAFTAPVEGGSARKGSTYPIAQAPAELRPAIQRADGAIIELQTAILLELRQKLARDGPVVLMASCHLWGVAAASRVERQEGIAIGRTSNRLRNPKNAPRSWAASIVKLYGDRPPPDVGGYVIDLDDRVGVLRPSTCRPRAAPVTAR